MYLCAFLVCVILLFGFALGTVLGEFIAVYIDMVCHFSYSCSFDLFVLGDCDGMSSFWFLIVCGLLGC